MPRGSAQLYRGALAVRIVTLNETWAERRLSLCVRAGESPSSVARLLVDHLRAQALPNRHHRMNANSPLPHTWDVFCQVIDNFGDIGRVLAPVLPAGRARRAGAPLDRRRQRPGLDGAGRPPRVQVLPWPRHAPQDGPGDVVVEAFGWR